MRSFAARLGLPALAAALLVPVWAAAQPPASAAAGPAPTRPTAAGTGAPKHEDWRGCCGLPLWAEPGPMVAKGGSNRAFMGGYASIVAGSTVRHTAALEGHVPAAYAKLRNPLPATPENAKRGAAVYEAQCAACHGVTGLGDGPGSRELKPPPARLGWIARLRPSRWDGFMYWATVEGGQPFGTAMPAFKGKLSDDQIWAVIGYIQARMPKAAAAK